MAETIRALNTHEIGNYMPADELLNSQRAEVYATVGEQLMWCYELDGEVPTNVDFLVELSSGQRVAYSVGEAISIDVLD